MILATLGFVIGMMIVMIWPELRQLKIEAILTLAMVWLTAIAGSFEVVWQTEQKMNRKVATEILFPLTFLLIFWQIDSGKLIWVMLIYLVARIISLIVGRRWIRNKFDWSVIDSQKIRHLFKESWPMGLYLILFTAYDRTIDSVIISQFWGVAEVAIYGLAYKIYTVGLQPAYFLVSSVFPILASKSKNIDKIFKWSALVLVIGAIGAIIAGYWGAPWAVNVLGGDNFSESVVILRILILAFLFSYGGHLFGFTLISRNKQHIMLKIGIVVVVFNLILNLIFVPYFGIKGAALVTVASEFLGMSLMWWQLK
jgi:O-antigen/teichoic acid export membrane protein